MAGNTGKMTREAIAARGPRLALVKLLNGQFGIVSEDHIPPNALIYARSYTRRYLEQIAKAQGVTD